MTDVNFVERQQRLIVRMTEALVDARTSITADRQSLWDSTVNQTTNEIDDDERGPIHEYDRVLESIENALSYARGDDD